MPTGHPEDFREELKGFDNERNRTNYNHLITSNKTYIKEIY